MSGPGEDVVLREMRWWDIEPVLGLEAELFPQDAWSEGMYWSELANARGPRPTRYYLVAEDSGARLAGYGGLGVAGETADVMTIGVTGAHQGTGLGGRLLRALLSVAASFGCTEVLLEVRVDNATAQRLYARHGFTRIGYRRGYYQPGNIDALVMRCPLGPAPGQTPHRTAAGTAADGAAGTAEDNRELGRHG